MTHPADNPLSRRRFGAPRSTGTRPDDSTNLQFRAEAVGFLGVGCVPA